MRTLLRLLGSLKVAVPVLIAIAGVLAWGTIYEANFGTAAVQRVVYRSWWFDTLLAFLAVNLATAAAERYPWQRRHTPFLLAHLGIILILIGGIIGGRFGIDGQLIIPEGQAERVMQTFQHVLTVRQAGRPQKDTDLVQGSRLEVRGKDDVSTPANRASSNLEPRTSNEGVVQHPASPGVAQVIPTNFETRAWVHEPGAVFHVPLQQRRIELTVDRYLPNAQPRERVSGGGAGENPAVRVRIASGEDEDRVWLFARDDERFAVGWQEAHVLFLEPATPALFSELFEPPHASDSARGVVAVELTGLGVRREVPVPDDFSRPIPLAGTPYSVTFKDYFTDFAITEQGIVNRSDAPNNPAVALALSGPEGTDAILAFALHPDFAMSHLRQSRIPARVTYTRRATPSLPENSFCILRHPNGALSCVMTAAAGELVPVACEPGGRYRHWRLGYEFAIEAYEPRAAIEQEFANRDNEVKAEALHVVAREGDSSAQGWVALGTSAPLALGGDPLVVEYRAGQRPLPVTIKLLDFRKIDYPGTQMAQGFESDVQLNDPRRGLILMRTISMNKPLRYGGYSFYQSSYVPGSPETTILSVRNDPGTPLVYAGFITVIAGIIWLFAQRGGERPRGDSSPEPAVVSPEAEPVSVEQAAEA